MSWYNFTKRKCINCGYEFIQSNDTLSINTDKYNKCPICLSDSKSINSSKDIKINHPSLNNGTMLC